MKRETMAEAIARRLRGEYTEKEAEALAAIDPEYAKEEPGWREAKVKEAGSDSL